MPYITVQIQENDTKSKDTFVLESSLTHKNKGDILFSNDEITISYKKEINANLYEDYCPIDSFQKELDTSNFKIHDDSDWNKKPYVLKNIASYLNKLQYEKVNSQSYILHGLNSDFSLAHIKKDEENFWIETEKRINSYGDKVSYLKRFDNAQGVLDFLNKIGYEPLPSLDANNILSEKEPTLEDISESTRITGNFFLSYENEYADNSMSSKGLSGVSDIYNYIQQSGALYSIPGNSSSINLGTYSLFHSHFTSDGIDRGDSHINPKTTTTESPLFKEILSQLTYSQNPRI